MIDPVLGLLLPPAIGVFGWLCTLPAWFAERRQARTPEGRRQVAFSRLVDQYQSTGLSLSDAGRKAMNHVSALEYVEEFRRFACVVYAKEGKPLADLKTEWWNARGKSIEYAKGVTQPKAEAARQCAALRQTIFDTPADEIFVHEPAAAKWKAEKVQRDAEIEAFRKKAKPDPISDYVLDELYRSW